MRFDLENSTGEWFRFFESEVKENGDVKYLDPAEDAGKVCLRIADPETLEKIQAQTRKKKEAEFVLNPKSRQMERVMFTPEQTSAQEKLERELLWDHVIVDWKNLLDVKNQQIPCTLENKMRLMNNPQFARFIGRCLQLISGAMAESKEASEKN